MISPSEPFIHACVTHLLQAHTPRTLAHTMIMVPNQRIGKILRKAFSDRSPSSCLLPDMMAMQHLNVTALLKWLGHHAAARAALVQVPPAMPAHTRLSLITAQVRALGEGFEAFAALPRAMATATSLIHIHDLCLLHQVTTAQVHEHFSAYAGHHYAGVLHRLFGIVQENWPKLCMAYGAVSAPERQLLLQEILIRHLPDLKEDSHVLVLGSTGSIASTRALMKAVAAHPRGNILIPGAGYAATMAEATHHLRASMAECFPTQTITTKKTQAPLAHAYIVRSSEEEAQAIALLVRETLVTSKDSCLIITPDMALAKRIHQHLIREHILPDGLAVTLLSAQPAMRLLFVCLQMIASPKDVLKCRLLMECVRPENDDAAKDWQNFIRLMDRTTMRKPYLRREILPSDTPATMQRFLQLWQNFIAALLPEKSLLLTATAWLEHIENTLKTLTAFHAPLLEDDVRESLQAYDILGKLSIAQMLQLTEVIGQRPASASGLRPHPRVHILTPAEARLVPADHVIFASFHSENWPQISTQNAWLSQRIAEKIGLPTAQDEIALAAHDVWMHSQSAARISCTRAVHDGGSVTQASPLAALLNMQPATRNLSEILQQISKPAHYAPLTQALPNPPIAARPRTLKISALDGLLKDPYSLYAKTILGLSALDDYGTNATARELGTTAHRLMQDVMEEKVTVTTIDRYLEQAMKPYRLSEIEKRFWHQRLYTIATYGEDLRRDLLAQGLTIVSEAPLSASVTLKENASITLDGRADLITHQQQGNCTITDFKTGSLITKAEMVNGKSAQHLGYSMLLQALGKHSEHWQCIRLPHAHQKAEISEFELVPEDYTARKEALLAELYATCFEETPFPAHPLQEEGVEGYRDYDGISRIGEWG